jgi:hypothetical protein
VGDIGVVFDITYEGAQGILMIVSDPAAVPKCNNTRDH